MSGDGATDYFRRKIALVSDNLQKLQSVRDQKLEAYLAVAQALQQRSQGGATADAETEGG
jgi:hypothetical protein